MRQIKFRAWDKNNKKMIFSNDMQKLEIGIYIQDFNQELMQFTGLKDKNGKEIYEGDIVKISNKSYKIEWNQLHCSWGLFGLKGGMERDITADWINDDGTTPKRWEVKYYEVIGNIYENPELIEENK